MKDGKRIFCFLFFLGGVFGCKPISHSEKEFGLWILLKGIPEEGAHLELTEVHEAGKDYKVAEVERRGMPGWTVTGLGEGPVGGFALKGNIILGNGERIPFETVGPFHISIVVLSKDEGKLKQEKYYRM